MRLYSFIHSVLVPARLNRIAINNKKCQILGGIDHSDRLEINLWVGAVLVDSVVDFWSVRQPTQRLCLCARVSVQSVFLDPPVASVCDL